jgi:hypothetical protein
MICQNGLLFVNRRYPWWIGHHQHRDHEPMPFD